MAAAAPKFGSGKSAGREAFVKRYPAAFNQTPQFQPTVFHDSMQALKGMFLATDRASWRDFVVNLGKEAGLTFTKHPEVKTFVFCFDNYPDVVSAKSCEQQKRSEQQSRGGGNTLGDFEITGLSDRIHENFLAAVHDRTYWTGQLVRYAVKHWSTDVPLDIPYGCTVVVSGHYLQYGDLPVPVEPDAPIQLIPRMPPEDVAVRFLTPLTHTTGEADFGMFWLMDQMCQSHGATILSVDSDMLYYGLEYLRKRPNFELTWRFRPSLSWAVGMNPYPKIDQVLKDGSVKNQQDWCHMNSLYDAIVTDITDLPPEERIPTAIVVGLAAGNDYVDSVPRVPPPHFVRGCLNNAKFLRGLVEFEGESWRIKRGTGTFRRLIEIAARQASAGHQKAYTYTPSDTTFPRTMLGMNDTIHHLHHVEYVVDLMRHLGRPSVPEGLLCRYSYGRIDPTKPPLAGNLKRLHGNDNFESWTLGEQQQPRVPSAPQVLTPVAAAAAAAPPPAPPDHPLGEWLLSMFSEMPDHLFAMALEGDLVKEVEWAMVNCER